MRVRWTRRAIRDLESVHAYIAADNPDAAIEMIARIEAAADHLGHNPEMGRPGRVAGTRELVVPPYVIAYRYRKGVVAIVAIIHGARRWPESF